MFWYFLFALFTLFNLFGCASWKAVDTTKAVDYSTRAESHVTYTMIPGDLLKNNPELEGKVLALPTVPGKDVDFQMYDSNGNLVINLKTRRTDVINALWASVQTTDDRKFVEAALERQFFSDMFDKMAAMIQPYITPTRVESSNNSMKDELIKKLIEKLDK